MRQRHALLVLASFLLMLSLTSSLWASNQNWPVKVTFINVDQGESTLIRTPQKTILIDAGDDTKDAAVTYIIPYLKKEGIKQIDQAIITHPHRDHFGGFLELIKQYDVKEVIYSEDDKMDPETGKKASADAIFYNQLKDLIKSKNIPYRQAKLGEFLDWGQGVKAEVLSCDQPAIYEGVKTVNPNELSIVIKMTFGKISYLFTGDAEKKAESLMIEKYGSKLASTVLQAGHHGSNTSSSHAFMDMVRPAYGIISCGRRNQFKHPSQSTLDIYKYYNMKIFRTDEDNTIESYTDGKNIVFVTESSPIEITQPPQVISISPTSATVAWKTNREATSAVYYDLNGKQVAKTFDNATKNHIVTLTGLSPEKTYKFTVVSTDPREKTDKAQATGSLTTPKGSAASAVIAGIQPNSMPIYMKQAFKISVPVTNKGNTAVTGLTLTLYHSAIDSTNQLGTAKLQSIAAGKSLNAVFEASFDWLGSFDLIAVLKKGNQIVDTTSLSIAVKPKIILVDASHGNIDYFTGNFAGLKMDLFQTLGFQLSSISKPITYEFIKDAFIVMIPSPRKEFASTEITALSKYVKEGGSVMMFSMSDYKNLSNPQILNKVLQGIGSTMRFNDDQVCDPKNNIGPHYRFFVTHFPSPAVTGSKVKKLLMLSSSSLLNSQMKPMKNTKKVKLVACAGAGAYNLDSDGNADAVFYPKSETSLIPVIAVEDTGAGRIACYGEALYHDKWYADSSSNKSLDTNHINRAITLWLSYARRREISDIMERLAALDNERDLTVKADRYKEASAEIFEKINTASVRNDIIEAIRYEAAFHASESVTSLLEDLESIVRFDELHRY